MSRAVMLSIRPEWIKKILSGEKTLEIRKTKPKLETPFKCYIYCTKNGGPIWRIHKDVEELFPDEATNFLRLSDEGKSKYADLGNGMVMGEFVCDYIHFIDDSYNPKKWIRAKSCLSTEQIREYSDYEHDLFAWHISEIKVYDKPKPLSDFAPDCKYLDSGECEGVKYVDCLHQIVDYNPDGTANVVMCKKRMHRPPQSWCYVGELQ